MRVEKKTGHGFQTRRNNSTDVITASRYDIECHSGPEIDHDRRITIQLRDCGGVREPIGPDRSRCRVINPDAKIKPRIQKEHGAKNLRPPRSPCFFCGTTEETTIVLTFRPRKIRRRNGDGELILSDDASASRAAASSRKQASCKNC